MPVRRVRITACKQCLGVIHSEVLGKDRFPVVFVLFECTCFITGTDDEFKRLDLGFRYASVFKGCLTLYTGRGGELQKIGE